LAEPFSTNVENKLIGEIRPLFSMHLIVSAFVEMGIYDENITPLDIFCAQKNREPRQLQLDIADPKIQLEL